MDAANNRFIIPQPTVVPIITFASHTAETTAMQISIGSPHIKRVSPCTIIFFLPSDGVTYHCDDLTDIDDLIAKYTATDADKKAFQQAQQELHEELRQDVLAGKLNKVKYYRLISSMDQKMLSDLTGIKQSNISRIERLGYTADIDTYKKIAGVFNIDYKELLP
jgi:hypothetical protein